MAWCVGCSQRGAHWPVTRNVRGCLHHLGVLIDDCPNTVRGRPHQPTVNGSQLGSERGGTVGYPYGGAADSPSEALLIAGEAEAAVAGWVGCILSEVASGRLDQIGGGENDR
jgi:hypothetical protein